MIKLPRFLTAETPFSKLLAMLVVIVLPIFGFFLGIRYQETIGLAQEFEKERNLLITPTLTPIDETANWKIYIDNELGIQYKYPNSLETRKSGKDDLYVATYTIGKYIDPKLPGIPSLDRIDIQILPQDSQFLLDNRKSLFNLQVGKSVDISPTNSKQFGEGPWTFKRLSDIDVNGNAGKSFISNGVWQASAGAYEKRVYVTRDEYIYMFRSYIVGGDITEKIFDQVLSTFKFTN